MSDCSTAAMLPKEQPKTCGTCFYSLPRKYGHWTTNDLICLKHAVSTNSDRCGPAMPCGMHYSEPAGWKPKNAGTSEQRFQQLELIALDMLDDIYYAHLTGMKLTFGNYRRYSEQLEALGVSVDD